MNVLCFQEKGLFLLIMEKISKIVYNLRILGIFIFIFDQRGYFNFTLHVTPKLRLKNLLFFKGSKSGFIEGWVNKTGLRLS